MRTIEPKPRNIYKTARTVAGLTQERWVEAVGVSVDSIRGYENGAVIPTDETVRAMSEISGLAPLSYWHLCNKSTLASDTLPEVEQLPLPQAVLQLLDAIRAFTSSYDRVIELAADGQITVEERSDWIIIKNYLDRIVCAAIQVKVAEGGA
ncbi:MAG: helix-turn-helix domain-containing protein [Oscillospiraceae bacterium]|nr:helix-turn-helix domain-containing protein [Oscillospiraceae bacterium]